MYKIDYKCPNCGYRWAEYYDCACDSECSECGTRDITAVDWEVEDFIQFCEV